MANIARLSPVPRLFQATQTLPLSTAKLWERLRIVRAHRACVKDGRFKIPR